LIPNKQYNLLNTSKTDNIHAWLLPDIQLQQVRWHSILNERRFSPLENVIYYYLLSKNWLFTRNFLCSL